MADAHLITGSTPNNSHCCQPAMNQTHGPSTVYVGCQNNKILLGIFVVFFYKVTKKTIKKDIKKQLG